MSNADQHSKMKFKYYVFYNLISIENVLALSVHYFRFSLIFIFLLQFIQGFSQIDWTKPSYLR